MIRVALIDDHPLILKIVRQELARSTDLDIIWDANDSGQVMSLVAANMPDVLVLDLSFAGRGFDPVTTVHDLRARFPQVKILILTAFDDPIWIQEFLRPALHAHVFKTDSIAPPHPAP